MPSTPVEIEPPGTGDRIRRTTRHASAAPLRLGSIVARGPLSGGGDGSADPCRPRPVAHHTGPSVSTRARDEKLALRARRYSLIFMSSNEGKGLIQTDVMVC